MKTPSVQYIHTCTCSCLIMCSNIINSIQYTLECTCTSEFLIGFEAWAKLAQKSLVCVPFRIHLEPVNAVSDNIIIINCPTGPKRELCSAK